MIKLYYKIALELSHTVASGNDNSINTLIHINSYKNGTKAYYTISDNLRCT